MSSSIRVAPDFDVLYPAASATATECAMNLVFTADLLQKRIATLLQPLHLTPTSGLVLSILANAESPLPPNEIADRLIISRATVTGLLDSLERRAYIRRRPHPSDRRMILAEITETGRQAASTFRPIVHQHEKEWFRVLDETEQQQLLVALHHLQESLRDSD
jgi:MarR family 2-MHQ and catechol resistance regulon transcriptional repressor